jgi:hypothetical protein
MIVRVYQIKGVLGFSTIFEKLKNPKRGDGSRICIKLLGGKGRTGESGRFGHTEFGRLLRVRNREANPPSYFSANVASYQ